MHRIHDTPKGHGTIRNLHQHRSLQLNTLRKEDASLLETNAGRGQSTYLKITSTDRNNVSR